MEYSIKQVAERTKLTPYTLRYYEKEGLLSSIERNDGGSRRFSEDDLEWLLLICCLKNTGMSIKQIKEYVDLCKAGDGTLRMRYELLVDHKRQVEEQIRTMEMHLKKVDCKIDWTLSMLKGAEDTSPLEVVDT